MIVIPSQMGKLNRRALLARLQRLGCASRAELAKSLNLSQPTAGKIVDDFLSQGIIEETGTAADSTATRSNPAERRSRAGRPGRVLRLNQTRARFLGIHLDISETRYALMPVCPRATDEWRLIVPTAGDGPGWLRQLRLASERLSADELLGIILCVPGIVEEGSRRVLFSPNLHWTEKAGLPALLNEVWDLPVAMVQELRALALGHQTFDTSEEDFLAVDIGEGVGAAAIVAGRLYANQLPLSGELGHNPVAGNQRLCGCGATGCLETMLSRRGLLESYTENTSGQGCDWDSFVAAIQKRGTPDWLGQTLDAAGAIIAGTLNVLGLRKVVLTGVLSDLPNTVHRHLATAIARGALWQRFGEISCVFAPRHHTAGMVAVGIDRFVVPAEPFVTMAQVPATPYQLTG